MKKLLLSFLTMVVAVVCGVSASAQSWSTTIKWTDPGSIVIKKGTSFSAATDVEIAPGSTSVILTEATGYFVIAADGYAITSADLDGTSKPIGLVDYSSGVKGVSIRAQYAGDKNAYNGKTLVVETVKLEYKPFNLEVANGASGLTFKFYNNGSEVSTLSGVADGKNSLEFPTTANQLFVQSSSYSRAALYSVQLEGVEQTEYNTLQHSYLVPLTEGCNIYVAKTEPATAKNYDVTFKFTNNNPNIVETIRDWSASTFIFPAEFSKTGYKLIVPADGQISFNWNPEAEIKDLTQNGASVSTKQGNKFTINENTEFVVTGTMKSYAVKTVQLYLTDAENVDFTANGEDLQLTYVKDVPAGTVTLESGFTIGVDTKLYEAKVEDKENAGVMFEVHEGYYVKTGIRGKLAGAYAESADVNLDGTSKIMLENMPLFLDVAKINYSATAWVYYQGPTNAGKLQCKSPDGMFAKYEGQVDNLAEGWTKIMFDPEYNSLFTARIAITFDNQNWAKVVELDGTALGADENDNYNMPFSGTNTGNEDGKKVNNGKMENNSVLKMFFTPVAVAPYYTTIESVATKDAVITYDNCKTVDLNTETKITNYGPTPYVIKPGEGVIVKINGVAQEPNAEGVVEYTATEATTIVLDIIRDNTAEPGVAVGAGTTVRNIKSITYNIPFDGEHSIWCDDITSVTITPKTTARAAEPIHATTVEPGDPSETSIPFVISFEQDITEAGEYTLDIPAGVFYQTAWDEASQSFTYQPGCKGFAAYNATFTVNPDLAYTYTFDPANGSVNDLPEDGQVIKITVDGDSFEAPETAAVKVQYNGVDLKNVEDAYEELGWSWEPTYNNKAIAIYVSQEAFTLAGKLTITVEADELTIDGKQKSPAIEYSATFGEIKEYNVVLTPEAGSAVPALAPEFKVTFEGAKTLAINGDMFDAYFKQGLTAGIQIFASQVTIEGNTATIKLENEDKFPIGNYTLEILERSFVIDGAQVNSDITAEYVIERDTEYNQNWTPNPTTGVVNYGTGIGVAFVFGENETVSKGTAFDQIDITFDGEKLEPYNKETHEVEGYVIEFEPQMPNAIMISAKGGKISKNTTSGELTVTLPVGSINISGKPLEKEATYSWNLLAYREYAMNFDPASGSKVKEISKITVTFPDAKSVSLSEFFNLGKVSVKQGYEVKAKAMSVEPVADAEVPTFEIEFEPITEVGDYTVTIAYGTFMLDDVFESDPVYLDYIVSAKDYAVEFDPAPGSKVKELSQVKLTFTDAETVELSKIYDAGMITLKKDGWQIKSMAGPVTPVENAEHPTFIISFATPVVDAANITVEIASGTFTIDGQYASDKITADYIVDPESTGIEGITAEDGLYTVVSLQGVVLMKNVEAAEVQTLPTGLYIINGQKVYIRK